MKIFIIDLYSVIFKSYYAIKSLTNSTGFPTNAIFGTVKTILKIIKNFDPDNLIIVADSGKKTFRNDIYKDYKANRLEAPDDLKLQFPVIKEILMQMNFYLLEKEDYEADDLIYSLAKDFSSKSQEIMIYTSDKDLYQLTNENVKIISESKSKGTVISGHEETKEKFGVYPKQILDFLALTGDTSDNIPGVKGIGPKTAGKLLSEFDNIDDIYKSIDKIKNDNLKNKLLNGKDNAFLSRNLAMLRYVDLSNQINIDQLKQYNLSNGIEILKKYELNSIIKEILPSTNYDLFNLPDNNDEVQKDFLEDFNPDIYYVNSFLEDTNNSLLNNSYLFCYSVQIHKNTYIIMSDFKKYVVIKCEDELENANANANANINANLYENPNTNVTANANANSNANTNATAKESATAKENATANSNMPTTTNVTANANTNPNTNKNSNTNTIDNEIIKRRITNLILNSNKLLFYNTKHFLRYYVENLSSFQIESILNKSFDILLSTYLIDSDESPIALERLINKYNNKKYYYDIQNKKTPTEKIIKYYCYLIKEMSTIEKELQNELNKMYLEEVYNKIEYPLITILLKMEKDGICIDSTYLQKIHIKLLEDVESLTSDIIKYTGHNVNINSSKQLANVLFEKLNLPTVKKIKSGFSTDNEVLEKLADMHPLPKLLLEYRSLTKLINTYTANYLKFKKNNRIHTTFNQSITVTGRLSSSEPNLQNIPVQSDDTYSIRKIFVAEENCFLVSADYSQIELRVLAHLSEDENMINAFQNNEDIHTKTAKEIFGSLLPITPFQRRIAKTVNFAIIYGMGSYSLSKDLKITRKNADTYITTYFKRYPKIRQYLDSVIEFAQQNGYVQTMFGRKRFIKTINDKNKNIRSSAERMAINMPVQGTASDIMKLAMIEVFNRLKDYKTKMCLTVHDEIVFNVPKNELNDLKQIIIESMANVVKLKVPLKVDIKVGKNWSE